jgi:CDP-glucose 4,6-dehydratase
MEGGNGSVENLVMDTKAEFWRGKKVFVTGHTGFKGTWLCLWLELLGAKVTGYALPPQNAPSLFDLCGLEHTVPTCYADIRDKDRLGSALLAAKPDIVFHMAAQPLVRYSYKDPVATFETNVMGTVYLLEAVRQAVNNGVHVKAVVNVTTDKCYDNQEWDWGYRETDRLGGGDPYSGSKACSEWVTASYRKSFFPLETYAEHGVAIATARAGNVIGGGDWSQDRLIPDCIRALLCGQPINIRNPDAVRPWQHVLEPLHGYLLLAQRLAEGGGSYAEGWNFGPREEDSLPVRHIVERLCNKWQGGAALNVTPDVAMHEAHQLRLDSSKANRRLGWRPRWNIDQAIDKLLEWTEAYRRQEDILAVSRKQIIEFETVMKA